MKKRFIAAILFLSLFSVSASAYDSYCEIIAVKNVGNDYTAQLKEISDRFDSTLKELSSDTEGEDEAVDSASQIAELYSQRIELFNEFSAQIAQQEMSLASTLIDYDVLLKRLKLRLTEYGKYRSEAESLSKQYLMGGCELSDIESKEKAADETYIEIKALLAEISALRSEIERMTGEPLPSDFDFDCAYFITDALKLDPEGLSGILGAASLCVPKGAEGAEYEVPDITSQYNSAVESYYALGTVLKAYISMVEQAKKGEENLRLGMISSDAFAVLIEARDSAQIAVVQSKANYAKSLMALDAACGGALTDELGVSGEMAAAYRSAVSDMRRGDGLWLVGKTAEGTVFSPVMLPQEIYFGKNDTGRYSISYNGVQIGSSPIGQACTVSAVEYADGCEYAEIVFYRNGAKAGSYYIDVFSPYGEFIKIPLSGVQ